MSNTLMPLANARTFLRHAGFNAFEKGNYLVVETYSGTPKAKTYIDSDQMVARRAVEWLFAQNRGVHVFKNTTKPGESGDQWIAVFSRNGHVVHAESAINARFAVSKMENWKAANGYD